MLMPPSDDILRAGVDSRLRLAAQAHTLVLMHDIPGLSEQYPAPGVVGDDVGMSVGGAVGLGVGSSVG